MKESKVNGRFKNIQDDVMLFELCELGEVVWIPFSVVMSFVINQSINRT